MKNVISILVIIIVGLFVITTQLSPEYYGKEFWRYPKAALYKFKEWPDYIRCMNQARSFENSGTTREEFNKYFAPASGMSDQSGYHEFMLRGCKFGFQAVEVRATFDASGREPVYRKVCHGDPGAYDCQIEDIGDNWGRPDDRLQTISKPYLGTFSSD